MRKSWPRRSKRRWERKLLLSSVESCSRGELSRSVSSLESSLRPCTLCAAESQVSDQGGTMPITEVEKQRKWDWALENLGKDHRIVITSEGVIRVERKKKTRYKPMGHGPWRAHPRLYTRA